jgi:hypothetical protein
MLGLVAATAAVASVVALSVPTIASARDCLVDTAGNVSYGTLQYNSERYLALASIHTSTWDGDRSYFARRYDSALNMTFQNYISSGGYTWGTSGNTTRRTAITPGSSAGLDTWYESESTICG